jgi:hypothetical protein
MGGNIMLKELVNTGHLYGYKLSDGGLGIVLAATPEVARETIKNAYKKHGLPDYDFSDLEIWKIDQKPFCDAPNVLEIYEY